MSLWQVNNMHSLTKLRPLSLHSTKDYASWDSPSPHHPTQELFFITFFQVYNRYDVLPDTPSPTMSRKTTSPRCKRTSTTPGISLHEVTLQHVVTTHGFPKAHVHHGHPYSASLDDVLLDSVVEITC